MAVSTSAGFDEQPTPKPIAPSVNTKVSEKRRFESE